jgi:L-fuconolactonase
VSGSPVVDSHVHFWDPARLHYAWLSGDLLRAFRPDDIPLGPVPVDAFVFVEADRRPSESMAEVDWALSVSSPRRPIRAVVAAASLESATASVQLDALGGRPEVRGIRRLLQDTRPGFCLQPGFVAAVRSLGQRDLVFDLCVRDHQLAEATALATQCPEVTFVLDHLGKPQVTPHPDRSWLKDIERLAALPNTRCKLSGLTSEVRDPVGDAERRTIFAPYLAHALQTFGPSRCLFGSDWPVSSLTVTYEGWFDQVVDALTGFTSEDAASVLGGTAREVYRIPAVEPGSASLEADAKVPTMPGRVRGGEFTWR